jgi:hypothetical protein
MAVNYSSVCFITLSSLMTRYIKLFWSNIHHHGIFAYYFDCGYAGSGVIKVL